MTVLARRRQQGKYDESIRREVLTVGLKATRQHVPDEMEQETAVATIHREIHRIIADGEPLADLLAVFPDLDP